MISMSVCLSTCITRKSLDQTSLNFFYSCCLPVAVARSYCDGVAIHYVLPVFSEEVVFSYHGASGQNPESTMKFICLEVRQLAVPVGRQTTTVFEFIRVQYQGQSLLSTVDLSFIIRAVPGT